MYKVILFKDFSLILFIITLPYIVYCNHKQNICATEHTVIKAHGRNYDIVWKSKSDSNYSVVLSDPPCLDINKNLVVRICLDGTWTTSKDICSYIEENTLCPPEFTQDENLCVYTTKAQIWDRNCPYHGASSEIKISYNMVWLPVKRQIQYGPFEFILPGEKYGLEFSDRHSSDIDDILDTNGKDCVTASKNSIEFTSCYSMHPHVCSYKYDQFLYRCPPSCVPGGLGSNYCFCKVVNMTEKNLPRNTWCETLAAPRYSYERSILHTLAGDDTCWIENLQEYSNIKIEQSKTVLYLAINKHNWSLERNRALNCAICKVGTILYHKVDLLLKFNTKSHALYLNVYSPESTFKDDEEDMVYCFTDATDKLKSRVDIEEVWDSESNTGRRLKVFRVSITEDGPGNYWCEAFQMPNLSLIKSNTVVAYKDSKGRDYSLRLLLYNLCRFSEIHCRNPSFSFINHVSKSLFNGNFFSKVLKNIRIFRIYNVDKRNGRADILVHLTAKTKLTLEDEYFALYGHLNLIRLKETEVIYFSSSEFCLSEYTVLGNAILNWKTSAIGTSITPKEICVLENGTPVRRKCKGDFLSGSKWGNIEGNCSEIFQLSSKTQLLHSLVSSNISPNLTQNISLATKNSTDLTVLDLHYLAEVLLKTSTLNQTISGEYVAEMSEIVNNLMNINSTTLKNSQIFLNATDEILDTFENSLFSVNTSDDLFLLKKSNLIIQISKPFLNNITGLVLYGNSDTSFLDFTVANLYANTSFDLLLDDGNLEIAVYVPEKLLNSIFDNLTIEIQSNLIIITTVFYTDNFFNTETNETNTVGSRIVSVSIPGYGEFLQTAIPIIFKSSSHHNQSECAFWNYGTSSETLRGYWSTLGGDYLGPVNNSFLEVCSFTHLTNFALLIRSEKVSVSDEDSVSYNVTTEFHDKILTVISTTGCSLSFIGIFGIFITGFVFKSWREKVGTRILIQLCITILLLMIFFNFANVRTSSSKLSVNYCIAVGIILHYIIISEFSWMLVAAMLQFLRFVKVIGPTPNRIILKAMLIGWGLPILPVMIVCAIDYRNYSGGMQGFCYPKGLSMYYGILLPITVIIIANLIVFIAVIRNVFVLRVEARGNSQTILKRQICLAVLLFFLLGLPWIFGLLSEIIDHDSVFSYIFIYLFCLTATLQGFVLFIFYVVLDKSTRTLWFTLIKRNLNRNF